MYLESLEIHGFKSFPEKIKLDFGKGITAIVGPNGSGKSNIGDAVRWVLGEQSSKTLRGGKMEDVIFAGTGVRKAMSFASVTLNIQNDRGVLSAPNGLLSVTRKLFRNGDSEYIINGSQARLRDIIELFMDTGLGRDGYAIIGQGKIAEIISNKSTDRREIFEEASGISKLRYKRDNAGRDLARAEESLLRLNDIMSELEGRIEPLRQQSEQAKKFIEIEERRKSLEISVWVSQMETLQRNINAFSDEMLLKKSAYEQNAAEADRIENENNALAEQSNDLQFQIETIRADIGEYEKKTAGILSDIAVAENDITHAKTRIKETEEAIKEVREQGVNTADIIAAKQKLLGQKQAEIEKVKAETEAKEKSLSSQDTDNAAVDEDIKKKSAELNALYLKESEYRFAMENAGVMAADAQTQADALKLREGELNKEIETLEHEKKELTAGFADIEERKSEFENRLSGLTKLHKSRGDKLADAQAEAENLRLSAQEHEQRIRLLTDLDRNMEGFAHSVKEILKMGRNGALRGICGTVGDLLTTDRAYALAIETALGAALQNVVVETEASAKSAINHLKETRAGRATFLPLTSVKGRIMNEKIDGCEGYCGNACDLVKFDNKYKNIFENLLGRVAVFEDLDTATEAGRKFNYSFKIVTTDGQVINAGGSFTGGSSSKQGGILTRKDEISRLTKSRDEIVVKLSAAKERASKLAEEHNKMGFDIEGVREALRGIDADIIRFESEQKRIETLRERLLAEIKTNEKTVLESLRRIKELEAGVGQNKENLTAVADKIALLERELTDAGEKQTELAGHRAELSRIISDLRLHETEIRKDCDAITGEINALTERQKQSGDSSERLSGIIAEQQALIAAKEIYIKECKESAQNDSDIVAAKMDTISKLREQNSECERRVNENRRREKDVFDRREALGKDLSRAEERMKVSQASFDNLVSELSEQYGLYYSEAREIAKPITDTNAAARELGSLRNKIKALGVVNLAAIEEFKEVSERYTFMKGQIDDVKKSKHELERLIGELTDRMKLMFTEHFNQINTHFKRIFIDLFGGGKADLRLSDPDDVLESGIEINVAPPGKVIRNLSLLSGGEQAFVAIAIYFAILSVKPSPFCILDEIEAALDDINVVKYARALRRFTDTTQFICVTHRRGTMEEADILYGVTMQEKGISRVLRM